MVGYTGGQDTKKDGAGSSGQVGSGNPCVSLSAASLPASCLRSHVITLHAAAFSHVSGSLYTNRRGVLPQKRIGAKERAGVEAALQAAFMSGGDDDWERLLELTGAASQDDARDGAPCVNLQHADTGEDSVHFQSDLRCLVPRGSCL